MKTHSIHNGHVCRVEITNGGRSPHTGRRLYVVDKQTFDLYILSIAPSDIFTYDARRMEGESFHEIQFRPRRGNPFNGTLLSYTEEAPHDEDRAPLTHLVHVHRTDTYEVAVSANSDDEALSDAKEILNQADDMDGFFLSTKDITADIRARLT